MQLHYLYIQPPEYIKGTTQRSHRIWGVQQKELKHTAHMMIIIDKGAHCLNLISVPLQ